MICACERPIVVAHSETCVKCGRTARREGASDARTVEVLAQVAAGMRRAGDVGKARPKRLAKYG